MIIPVPPGKQFLPYQEKFIRYAIQGKGTILADEMGLGKTIQAIGVVNVTKPKTVLIVCPAGLKLNWKNELNEWLVPSTNQNIHIVSYHEAELRLDYPSWDLLIVDEAHYIKNPQSQRSGIIKSLASKAERILLLTGTPMENRPVELWPLLQIANPEEWDPPNPRIGSYPEYRKTHPGEGPNFWKFAERYCDLKKSYYPARGGRRTAWDFSGASNLIELRTRLRETCMVRRLKKDVLPELPPKRHQVIVLPSKNVDDSDLIPELTEDNYYETISKLTAGKVLFEEYSKRRHEQALDQVDNTIEHVENCLEENDNKIILFAHHQDVINKLGSAFRELGRNPVIITGKTDLPERESAVHRFQTESQWRLFIGSIGAAGVGFTLTAAQHMIFAEIDPVPGRMNQCIDRMHRIGQQSESVLIQYLVPNKSLNSRIIKILIKKQAILTKVLDE